MQEIVDIWKARLLKFPCKEPYATKFFHVQAMHSLLYPLRISVDPWKHKPTAEELQILSTLYNLPPHQFFTDYHSRAYLLYSRITLIEDLESYLCQQESTLPSLNLTSQLSSISHSSAGQQARQMVMRALQARKTP